MYAPFLVLHSSCSTSRTTERKQVENKLLAKPNLPTTANSPNEHEDDVINIGEHNIDGNTISMMTAIVEPSIERGVGGGKAG